MSVRAPYQGAYQGPPQYQGGTYYGAAAPTTVVVAAPATPFGPFGQDRLIALVGGGIALLGLFMPWVQASFLGISAFSILSVASLLLQFGGALAALLILGVVISVVGVLGGLALVLLRYTPDGLKGSAVGGMLGIVGAVLFILGALVGGGLDGMGLGVFATMVGGAIQFIYSRKAKAAFATASYAPPAVAAAGYYAAPPVPEWGASAPSPSYATSVASYPCPGCGAAVRERAPACPSCGMALTW